MNILVLNGSPKGERGLTLHYAKRVMQVLPQHAFTVLHPGRHIHKLERDMGELDRCREAVAQAGAVLWCTPVYFLLVPSQLKRFIELARENWPEAFAGKFAAVMTTSIHFFDHTAHAYLRAVSEDLGMGFIAGLSADMKDIADPRGLERLDRFALHLDDCLEKGLSSPRRSYPAGGPGGEYVPGPPGKPLDASGVRTVVLTDRGSANLDRMVERFAGCFDSGVEVVDIREHGPKTGCRGCIRCAKDNHCALEEGDGFRELYLRLIREADCLVYAGALKDRWLSADWKRFWDRSFFMGHIPALDGKQAAMLVSGPLGSTPVAMETFEGYWENQHVRLVDVATDENPADLDRDLAGLAERLLWCARNKPGPSRTFRSEGGWKIFRDAIWGRLRYVFEADHRYYRQRGMYDFPQDNWGQRWRNLLMLTAKKSGRFQREFDRRIIDAITEDARKVLADNDPEAKP